MKKVVGFCFVATLMLSANDTFNLEPIEVDEKVNTKVIKNVYEENLKSADLAEALMRNNPSIIMIRRSGIANDIILRGQKRDNINILIDDAKIYGACPNRMDPPTSHVLSNNVQSVEVIEGPYDVENFGTLSGKIKVNTKRPKKGFNGEVNANFGSFSYHKFSTTISGGNDKLRALLSLSTEQSDQYKDGDGNTLAAQIEKKAASNANKYATNYKDKKAFEKKTLMSKVYFNFDDNNEINFSYTANRSDDILYANTPMDAIKDDSDMFALNFVSNNLSKYSQKFKLNTYYSKVEHPMATTYRNNGAMQMTNNMESKIKGLKLTNETSLDNSLLTLGVDSSIRTWEGYFSNKMNPYISDSISKSDTKDIAIFSKYERKFGNFDFETALRYDDVSIKTKGAEQNNDYDFVSIYALGTYSYNQSFKYFVGLGKSSRVPDARELYFKKGGNLIGTPNLSETTNYEIDFGFEKSFENTIIKSRVFYSMLKDYIYLNSSKTANKFENIDATIYGADISAYYYASDEIYFDFALAYQRGKKDDNLTNQSDKDLADIAPLRGTIGFNYEANQNKFRAFYQASKAWSSIDSQNGEQKLAGYGVLNLKFENSSIKNTKVTLGMDNIFDKTYAISNTYKDLTLVTAGGGETVLLNEPGRYVYLNIKYSF